MGRKPKYDFEKQAIKKRDQWVKLAFKRAIKKLEERLGKDTSNWTYGQAKNKHIGITHALGKVVKTPYKELLNLPALPRGGNSYILQDLQGTILIKAVVLPLGSL